MFKIRNRPSDLRRGGGRERAAELGFPSRAGVGSSRSPFPTTSDDPPAAPQRQPGCPPEIPFLWSFQDIIQPHSLNQISCPKKCF